MQVQNPTTMLVKKMIKTWECSPLQTKDLERIKLQDFKNALESTSRQIGSSYTSEIKNKYNNHTIIKMKGVCGSAYNRILNMPFDVDKTAVITFNEHGDCLQLAAYGKDSDFSIGQVLRTKLGKEFLEKISGKEKTLIKSVITRNGSKPVIEEGNIGEARRDFGIEFPKSH